MNQFLVILINAPSGSESVRLNQLVQGLDHKALERVFECVQGSQYPCPYPIDNVGQVPVLKFMLKRADGQYQEVDEMTSSITKDNVIKRLDGLAVTTFPDLTGQGGDGIIPSNTNPGGPVFNPFGLFDLPINPPGWMWLAIAGLAAYKASQSKSPAGMYVWGAAGLVAGLNWLNKRNRSISGIEIPEMVGPAFNKDATGDVVSGDVIEFREAVFEGSFKKPRYVGDRTIQARVLNESYGANKQQHTFTLEVLSSEGANAHEYKPGQTTRRKGRNIYKNGTYRQTWADESLRESVANEKHDRGDRARKVRDQRRSSIPGWG